MLRSALLILLVAIAATSADFECPETEGIFPDPDDCRSFYQVTTLSMMLCAIRVLKLTPLICLWGCDIFNFYDLRISVSNCNVNPDVCSASTAGRRSARPAPSVLRRLCSTTSSSSATTITRSTAATAQSLTATLPRPPSPQRLFKTRRPQFRFGYTTLFSPNNMHISDFDCCT